MISFCSIEKYVLMGFCIKKIDFERVNYKKLCLLLYRITN